MRRALSMVAIGVAAAASFAGCAFDWSAPAENADVDAGGIADASVTDTLLETSLPQKDGSSGDGGQVSKVCSQTSDCTSMKEYCHFSDFRCGKGDAAGICTAIPAACTVNDEVCSCNGKTYANECAAYVQGSDLSAAKNACPFDAGTQFQCGTHICEDNKEYCLQGSSPTTYACKSPSVSTGTCTVQLSCSCQSIIDLGCTCTGSPGAITLSGPGCKG